MPGPRNCIFAYKSCHQLWKKFFVDIVGCLRAFIVSFFCNMFSFQVKFVLLSTIPCSALSGFHFFRVVEAKYYAYKVESIYPNLCIALRFYCVRLKSYLFVIFFFIPGKFFFSLLFRVGVRKIRRKI